MIDEKKVLTKLENWAKKSKEEAGLKEPELLKKVIEEIQSMITVEWNEKYQHCKTHNHEIIEFNIMEDEKYITTCTVDVPAFRSGKNTFPCKNGDYVSLSIKQRLEIENLTRADSKTQEPMMVLTQKNGSVIKICLNDIKTIVYELARNLFGSAYLEAVGIDPSETMMVICMKNEIPVSFIAKNWVIDQEWGTQNESERCGSFKTSAVI